MVAFTPDGDVPEAQSVASLIVASGQADLHEAEAAYNAWLEQKRGDGDRIAIEGAGILGPEGFTTDAALHSALNPVNEDIVTMESEKRSTPLWVWVVIGVLAAAVIFCVIWCCRSGVFGSRRPSPETTVVTAPQPTAEEIAAAEAARAAAAAEAEAAARAAAAPRFHVIAGAFAIESNADNFIARLRREHPELVVEKLPNPSNGYNMVSIYQAPTDREARGKMNLYWDIDLYLWIYRER